MPPKLQFRVTACRHYGGREVAKGGLEAPEQPLLSGLAALAAALRNAFFSSKSSRSC